MPVAPVDHPLNTRTQTVLTVGGYAVWAGFAVYAALIGIRQRTPVHLVIIFAAGFGGLFEPLYGMAHDLCFYSPVLAARGLIRYRSRDRDGGRLTRP
jgi:hypothetical protein